MNNGYINIISSFFETRKLRKVITTIEQNQDNLRSDPYCFRCMIPGKGKFTFLETHSFLSLKKKNNDMSQGLSQNQDF